jgi:hypothetical protein
MGKESKAGRHPRGVSFDKSHRGKKKYKTRVFFNGKDRFIGRYDVGSGHSVAGISVQALPRQ